MWIGDEFEGKIENANTKKKEEYDNTENEKIVIQKQFNGFYISILLLFFLFRLTQMQTIFTETIPHGEIPRV